MDKGLVSLTFDDGLRCQFERAIPILGQYGLSATFFLVANTDPILTDGHSHPHWRKITWSAEDVQLLKGIAHQGHEIGARSVTHRLPELDIEPKLEVEGSKQRIESWLGLQVSSYCYPFCHVTDPIKGTVINAGYKQARAGVGGSYYNGQKSVDLFHVDSRLVWPKADVRKWVQPRCWHILMFHGIGTLNDGWAPIPVEQFAAQMRELARLRDSGAVEVVTFKDGASLMQRMMGEI
jgi:peptidoglycan/xylan/chitin deacetylase (PgdA/CDA1 family)